MALLSNTDDALIELIRNRLENNRTDFARLIDLLDVRIRESRNDDLREMKQEIERL